MLNKEQKMENGRDWEGPHWTNTRLRKRPRGVGMILANSEKHALEPEEDKNHPFDVRVQPKEWERPPPGPTLVKFQNNIITGSLKAKKKKSQVTKETHTDTFKVLK